MATPTINFNRELIQFENQTNAKTTLQWLTSQQLLKCTTSIIPNDFFPKDFEAISHEFVLKPIKKKGPLSDEIAYSQNREIWEKVPRGLGYVELKNKKNSESITFPAVFALRKFTGELDDDETQEVVSDKNFPPFFTQPITNATNIFVTEKANGEAAHFSCIRLFEGNYPYLCAIGSKNIHAFISSDYLKSKELFDQALALHLAPRFTFANYVLQTIFELFQKIGQENTDRFLEYVATNFYTAFFELLQPQYQHVEYFDFENRELKFIGFSSARMPTTTICANPIEAINFVKSCNISTVQTYLIPYNQIETAKLQTRVTFGKEGSVFYFLDINNNVIGLQKQKTVWYIIVRAIREKVRYFIRAYIKAVPNEKQRYYSIYL
eukprot:TRINITY_DN994_c2_g1_i2.p1 TRINITY_DN994_c2_g1~~TRINITY_DN994_c2_g1_i2.p1  ORF type:complete len:380 (-),score=172.42 TRINITY_DN994_c2_g1_i2:86-1225(-)